jgi:hypothetical protein
MISVIDLLWLLCNKYSLRKEGKHKELYKRRSTIQVFEKEGFSYIWQRRRLEQNESYNDDGNIDINTNMSIMCPFNINSNNNDNV